MKKTVNIDTSFYANISPETYKREIIELMGKHPDKEFIFDTNNPEQKIRIFHQEYTGTGYKGYLKEIFQDDGALFLVIKRERDSNLLLYERDYLHLPSCTYWLCKALYNLCELLGEDFLKIDFNK